MQKIILSFLILISPILSNSQEYVDLININYSKTGETSFENSPAKTTISIFDSKITLPIVINEKTAIITGFDFNLKKLQLFPNLNETHLFYTRLKLGVAKDHSENWSGTYVLLPILSSDYKKVTTADIYLGGLAVWTYKKRKNLNYKFGLYTGNEAYGFYITPLVGIYYINSHSSLEINSIFPGFIDINFSIINKIRLGIDYKGNSESFKIHNKNLPVTYAENNSLEFSTYLQNNSFSKNLLLRLKIGFATNTYEVYAAKDKVDLAITPFRIGDNRTKLNSNLNSSVFLKIEAIYRFELSSRIK